MVDVWAHTKKCFAFDWNGNLANQHSGDCNKDVALRAGEFHCIALKLFKALRMEFGVDSADRVTDVIMFDFEVNLWQVLVCIAWLLSPGSAVNTKTLRKFHANRTDYLLPSSAEDSLKNGRIEKGGFTRALEALKSSDVRASNAMRAYMLTFLMEANDHTLVRGYVGSCDQGYTPVQSRIALAIKIQWARLLGTLSVDTLRTISSAVGLTITGTKAAVEVIRASLLATYTGSGCVSRSTDTYAGLAFAAKLTEIMFVAVMPIRCSIGVDNIHKRQSLIGILVADFIAPGKEPGEIRKLVSRVENTKKWAWAAPKGEGAPLVGHHTWLQDSDKYKSSKAVEGRCDPVADCPGTEELLMYARTTEAPPGPPRPHAAADAVLKPVALARSACQPQQQQLPITPALSAAPCAGLALLTTAATSITNDGSTINDALRTLESISPSELTEILDGTPSRKKARCVPSSSQGQCKFGASGYSAFTESTTTMKTTTTFEVTHKTITRNMAVVSPAAKEMLGYFPPC